MRLYKKVTADVMIDDQMRMAMILETRVSRVAVVSSSLWSFCPGRRGVVSSMSNLNAWVR